MSNTLKYVLIAAGVLLVVALAVVVIFGVLGFGGMHYFSTQPGYQGPFGPFGRMPMMGGRLGPAAWITMLGVLCIPPLLLILLVGLVVGLVTRSRPVPPPQASQPSAAPQPPAVSMKACPNCGRQVQADWSHCPYCGQELVS